MEVKSDMSHGSGCLYTGIDREYSIEDLAAFHGHLGPYIVLGYRIGRHVRKNFCNDPFQMKASVFCEAAPPQSCLADGIQIGSGCTLGKRNIEIVQSDCIRCEFLCGERVMTVNPMRIAFPPWGGEDYGERIERLAVEMYSMKDSDLMESQVSLRPG